MKTRATGFLILALLALTGLQQARAQVPQVTFQLDARPLIEACQFGPGSANPAAFLSVRGSFNSYNEQDNLLTDEDGDGIYTATAEIPEGQEINYKFYHSILGWEDGVEGSTHPDKNRQYTVTAEAQQTIEPGLYNKPFSNLCGAQPQPVTFRLDAADLMAACQLGPNAAASDAFVSVRGDFNSYAEKELILTDDDGDGIYTVTVDVMPGDHDFKFYHSVISWENGVKGSTHPDGNRQFTVGTEPLELPVMKFNNTIPAVCGAQTECVDVFFRVNMGPQIASGNFVPGTNLVTVSGPYAGWNTTQDTLFADFFEPTVYSKLITFENQLVPGEIEYKFISGVVGESPGGWEEFAGNRFLTVTGNEEDTDGNGCIDVQADPVPYFNNVSFEGLFQQDAQVTVEVDLRPAYYFLKDSSYLPTTPDNLPIDDQLSAIESLFINGPLAGSWADEWSPEGLGLLSDRQLFDDGTHGDRVAGDSVFTWQTTKLAGSSRSTNFKFGVNAYDNENAGGGDHRIMIADEANPVVHVVFGAARQNDSTYTSAIYYPYISMGEGGPFVVRRGGSIVVGTERNDFELPSAVSLAQNYPNPFNRTATISYRFDRGGQVTLRVYDLTGRQVATLVQGVQPAGTHEVAFDATTLSSGTYFYRLETPSGAATRSMTLVR